jgi:hypothetical protein
MRKKISEWQKWWKKEMLISLSVFALLVIFLMILKYTVKEAPFLPLVLVFFSTFALLFGIAIWMSRKSHRRSHDGNI